MSTTMNSTTPLEEPDDAQLDTIKKLRDSTEDHRKG